MGLSEELVITSPVHHAYICSICKDVFLNPVMAEGCEHVFCKSCIEDWANRAEAIATCPIDRQAITGLKAAPRPFMDLYNSLELRCKFYASGCQATMNIGNMHDHPKSCEFNPTFKKSCMNGCGAILMRKDVECHNCLAVLQTIVKELKLDAELAKLKMEKLEEKVDLLESTNEKLKLSLEEALKEIREIPLLTLQISSSSKNTTASLQDVTVPSTDGGATSGMSGSGKGTALTKRLSDSQYLQFKCECERLKISGVGW